MGISKQYEFFERVNLDQYGNIGINIIDGTLPNNLNYDSLKSLGVVMNSDIVDEDNMVSNFSTKVPTQQSVKAYVDSKLNIPNLQNPILSKTFNINSPTGSDDITLFLTDFDIIVQEVITISTGNSPSTTYELKYGYDRNIVYNNLTNLTTTTSKSFGESAVLNEPIISSNNWLVFKSTAASGVDVMLTIHIKYIKK